MFGRPTSLPAWPTPRPPGRLQSRLAPSSLTSFGGGIVDLAKPILGGRGFGPLAGSGDAVALQKKRDAAAAVRRRHVHARGDLVARVVDEARLLHAGRELRVVEAEHLLKRQ